MAKWANSILAGFAIALAMHFATCEAEVAESKLKKESVVGAVAYGSQQLGKLSARYPSWEWGQKNGVGFTQWNDWRQADGFLCRFGHYQVLK